MTTNAKAGIALVAASVIGAVAMGFHPSGRDILTSAAGTGNNAPDVAVHLIAIAGELVLLLGTLALTVQLSATQRDLAVSAFVVYAAAIMSLVIAAVASGLIAPSIAAQMADTQGAARDA